MNFGEWIRSLRKVQKLDIRTLAERSGVEVSTISRVENERTQVTLLIAIRLCEGLGVTVSDVLSVVYGEGTFNGAQESMTEADALPTEYDVEQFLNYLHTNTGEGKAWLTDLLNRVVSMTRSTERSADVSKLFVPEDIHKLLIDSPVYRFEIQYPSAIKANDILAIHQRGGMLTLAEISEYSKKLRREKQVTLARLEQAAKLSPSVLSRLESPVIEQIKLADILMLDEQLGQGGTLLSMYWRVYSFYEKLVRLNGPSANQEMRLASIFITICRWLQFTNRQDISWMSKIRSYENEKMAIRQTLQ
jgi:transcriptional regulator with XRE-family HTH domain